MKKLLIVIGIHLACWLIINFIPRSLVPYVYIVGMLTAWIIVITIGWAAASSLLSGAGDDFNRRHK